MPPSPELSSRVARPKGRITTSGAWAVALAAIALGAACAGPPIPAPIEGLPICADFDLGHTKMEGTLRRPVRLRLLDGKEQVSKIMIFGARRAEDIKPRTFVADTNAEYNVEWAQCENERAPRSVQELARETGKAKDKLRESETAYECGDATVYKTEKLVTKKGDAGSHKLTFAAPPKPECWAGDVKPAAPAPAPAPSATPDAGAPAVDAGPPAVDAGPTAVDAGK